MKTCAFTGHRPKSVDMYAAEIVLALKEKYPQITLECAIPYERQAVRWPEALRNRYFFHRRALRLGDDAANTLYAGLPEEPEPLYGGACGYGAGSLQYAAAQRNAADGLVCTEPPETGMAGISGYLGTLCHIKRSPSALAEGFLLF